MKTRTQTYGVLELGYTTMLVLPAEEIPALMRLIGMGQVVVVRDRSGEYKHGLAPKDENGKAPRLPHVEYLTAEELEARYAQGIAIRRHEANEALRLAQVSPPAEQDGSNVVPLVAGE